ncbi:MAG: hypothetical protein M0Z75_05250 [Nitrospiraceae bacterium]|nr:hypothetical protein [Nitrospiraceae bacterium]
MKRAESSGNLNLAMVLALPLLLLAANPRWILIDPSTTLVDPYVYTGYLLDFRNHSRIFAGTYYGTRLGFLLPGVVLFSLLPPVAAEITLHLAFAYAGLLSAWFIARRTLGERAGLFAAVLMGGYSYFLFANSWDYVDGAAIAWYLMSMLALTHASGSRGKLPIFLAGVSFACMVHTELFIVQLAPALFLYYILMDRKGAKNPIWRQALLFAAGAAAITAAFGLVKMLMGQGFLFFMPSINFATGNIAKLNPWKTDYHLWLYSAVWLFIPSVLLLTSLLSIVLGRDKDRNALYLELHFLFSAAIMLAFQLWKGTCPFEYFYHASFLIPSAFLAAGAFLKQSLDRLSHKQFLFLGLFLVAAIIIPFSISGIPLRTGFGKSYPILLLMLLSGMALVFKWRPALPVFVVLFSLANYTFADSRLVKGEPFESRVDYFTALVKGVRKVGEMDMRTQGRLSFWYNWHALPPARSLCATYLWEYRMVNENFPGTGDGRCMNRMPISSLNEIAVLTPDGNSCGQASRVLAGLGLEARCISSTQIKSGQVRYDMTVVRIIHGAAPAGEKFPYTLFDYSGAGLYSHMQKNFYGGENLWRRLLERPAPPVLEMKKDGPFFHASDRRDHICTPFLPRVPRETGGGRYVKVIFSYPSGLPGPNCRAMLQDGKFASLDTFACYDPSRMEGKKTVFYSKLPQGAGKFRLVFTRGGEGTYLPVSVRIEQSGRDFAASGPHDVSGKNLRPKVK